MIAVVVCTAAFAFGQNGFVGVRGSQFYAAGKPYYFVGTNYWYGGLLGKRDVKRLRQELDFLQSRGVTNLRLMAGAEGSGLINGVTRVGPPLQPEQGPLREAGVAGRAGRAGKGGRRMPGG